MGRAIVASDLPSIREVLTDGVTASLVRPGDPAALAAALRTLAADPARASALGSAARRLAPRYTWSARAATIEAALAACA
jgi:glycosyltransferase involved in cell wall biosynthesis